METHLTLSSLISIFGIMVAGAMIPGVSVLTVTARSAAYGFVHGVFTTTGIAVGDVIFIIIAIYGLSVLVELMGNNFVVIKYLGGAYLIWLGIMLWRSKTKLEANKERMESSLWSSFLVGLLITLADQKAILFYFGFFPAFIDLTVVTVIDTSIIVAVATATIFASKLTYVYMANIASLKLTSSRLSKKLNIVAGSVMIGAGAYLIASA